MMPLRRTTTRRAPSAARGFSLLEVMIAVTVLGLIGALAYGTVARAADARDRTLAITRHYHGVRQAMLRMSREISMAYLSHHRDCEEERTRTAFHGHSAGGGMRLDFTAFSHFKSLADANESDQEELSYFVDDDPDRQGEKALIRRSQLRIDDDPEEGGTEEVLARGVTELELEFYDAKEDRWDDSWDSTSLDTKDRLPMFVKLTLKVKNDKGQPETFVTKTRVVLKQAILIPGTGFSRCPE